MKVLQDHHDAAPVGQSLQYVQIGLEESAAGLVSRQGGTLDANRRDDGLQARCELGSDQRLKPLLPEAAPQPAQGGHEGSVGKDSGVLRYAGTQQDRVVGGESPKERAHQARLAGPGLTGHQDGADALGPRCLPGAAHLVELTAPPHEGRLHASVEHQVPLRAKWKGSDAAQVSPASCSKARARRRTERSSPGLATTWSPIGMPLRSNPHGTLTAGSP